MSLPDVHPAFYAVAAFAILLTGITKSGLGAGGAGVAVPLMSLFIAPAHAAGIMLPVLCAMDVFGWLAYRGRSSRRHLAALLPGAALGIAIGALAFGALSVQAVRLLLGAIALLFPLNHWFRVTERLVARFGARPQPPGRIAGFAWGSLSGFTSTLAHAGGAPFAVYMLPQRLDKTLLVGTSVVFFLALNYTKLVPYYFLGQLGPGNLTLALLFAPLAPLGVRLGVWLHGRMSQALFYRFNYGLLFLTGLKLVADGIRG